LLAAIHRICQPGPKTEVADWYDRTVLRSQWGFAPERFTSQEFWDCFDRIPEEQLDQAQIRILGLWKEKQLVSRRLLAYDTTDLYTYVASTNERNHLAQRGHNKQGRHNLRQVGLSYLLDGENGMSLCHHVYPGNVANADELPEALSRMVVLLDRNQIARDTVTLVLDKGSAVLANTVELEKAGVGWISALPWNQAPVELREKRVEQLPVCGTAHPGVRAAAEKMLVHGKEYLCVLGYSACFASEQLHSLSATLTKVTQNLRRLAAELSKPQARFTEQGIRNKITRWLSDSFVREVLHYELKQRENRWHLSFQVDHPALQQLWSQRLGRVAHQPFGLDCRTSGGRVFRPCSGQQQIERVFRGLKDGEWLGLGPMYHWTDSKIRIHAFYCMLGISLLQYLHRESRNVWLGLSVEQFLEELRQIQQFVLLYPPLVTRDPIVSPQCYPSKPLLNKLSLNRLDWNNSVVPTVGNTPRSVQVSRNKTICPCLYLLSSKVLLGSRRRG
jgi:transposase